jgi:hypothetical protein
MTEILQTDNPEQSKKYASEAEKIINSDPRQIIRKQQLEIL